MKQQTLHCRREVLHDECTGRELWKMASWPGHHCVAPYMYFQAFARGEKYFVFLSDRTGRWELYRLEIESGDIKQLTDFSGSELPSHFVYAFNVHPDGDEVFFLTGNGISAAHIESGEVREVTRCPDGWRGRYAGPNFSPDGKQVFSLFQDSEGYEHVVGVPSDGGKARSLHRWHEQGSQINHLQVAPVDNLALTFSPLPDRQNNPDETRAHRARSWKLDAASGECEPFLVMPPGFRATHEFWAKTAPGGVRLFCHKKTVPTWTPTSLASIALDGSDFQEHYVSQDRKLGHSCLSPDGSTLVCDVQDATGNELFKVDLATGHAEILCWPNSLGENSDDGVQVGHVHPSFSPSGKYLIYTSDHCGHAEVFILPNLQ